MKTISVIIPFYNAEDYLEKCIYSFKSKNPQKVELILINDGSTDSSWHIANDILKKHSIDIILINKKNTGPGDSRNIGIQNASGKYICFMDSDDYVASTFIDTLIHEIENKNPELIFIPFTSINVEGERIGSSKSKYNIPTGPRKELISKLIQEDIFGYSGTKCVLRSIVVDNKIEIPKNLKICEDLLFTCDLVRKSKNITVLSKPQYFYLVSDNSLSRTFRKSMFEEYEYVNRRYFEFLLKENVDFAEKIICEKSAQTVINYLRMTKHYDKEKISINIRCNFIINTYSFKMLKKYKKYYFSSISGNKKYPLFLAIVIDSPLFLKILLKFV